MIEIDTLSCTTDRPHLAALILPSCCRLSPLSTRLRQIHSSVSKHMPVHAMVHRAPPASDRAINRPVHREGSTTGGEHPKEQGCRSRRLEPVANQNCFCVPLA